MTVDHARALALWPLYHQHVRAGRWRRAAEVLEQIEEALGLA